MGKIISKTSFLLFLVVIGCTTRSVEQPEPPEEPTFKLAESHLPIWEYAIDQLMELADAMPENQYNFTPHDSLRTFAEQLVHIGSSSKVIANLYMKGTPPSEQEPMNVAEMSREEVKEFVRNELEATGEIFSTVSDTEMLDTIQTFSGKTMTRLEGMISVHDHLTNHKAKANLYIRLTGNKPPEYQYY